MTLWDEIFIDDFTWRGTNFCQISIFGGPWGKLKSIFELAENLSLVLTKLDTELGLAQPQLVFIFFSARILNLQKLQSLNLHREWIFWGFLMSLLILPDDHTSHTKISDCLPLLEENLTDDVLIIQISDIWSWTFSFSGLIFYPARILKLQRFHH